MGHKRWCWILVCFVAGSAGNVAWGGNALLLGQAGFLPVTLGDGTIFLGNGPSPDQAPIFVGDNLNAADSTNADQLWSGGGLGLNLSGAGLTVGIWDGGAVRATHQEFGGRVTVVDNVGTADHATHVAGTIGAAGLVANAHGMANQVQIRSYDWNNDTTEMNAAASTIVASNHSYGYVTGWSTGTWTGISGNIDIWYDDRATLATESSDFGKYSSRSQSIDQLLYNNPKLLTVWAAGNERDDTFTNVHGDNTYVTYLSSGGASGPGWYQVSTSVWPAPPKDGGASGYDCLDAHGASKNTLVVGAVNDVTADPYTKTNITMTGFSSWGPTDDGRVKPDVVGNGSGLYSTLSTSNSSYGPMSGTSMATPNITGTATLLIQDYKNLHGTLPSSATTKGLLIHTAADAGNTGPDYTYGWGLADAAAAARFLADTDHKSTLLERNFHAAETYRLTVSTAGILKATLTWTDPAPLTLPGDGLDDATSVLVNDLNLWIVGPNGMIYYPWRLDKNNPANPALQTGLNHIDNVEQVYVAAAAAGVYTLYIGGTLGAGYSTQAFSLFTSGADEVLVPEPGTLVGLVGGAMGAVVVLARRRCRANFSSPARRK